MKIAAFYENIADASAATGIQVEDVIRRLMERGLSAVYVGGATLRDMGCQVEKIIKETGISVEGVHDWVDLAHDPDSGLLQDTVDWAAKLKAKNVLFVPGLLGETDDVDVYNSNIKKAMKRAVDYARQYDLPVSMENLDRLDCTYCSFEGLKAFLDGVPEMKCSLDTGNFMLVHDDELHALFEVSDRLCTIHLKDRSRKQLYDDIPAVYCNDGVPVYVTPVGYGDIKMREILDYLKEQNYSGNVIAELYGYSQEKMLEGLEQSIDWLKKELSQ